MSSELEGDRVRGVDRHPRMSRGPACSSPSGQPPQGPGALGVWVSVQDAPAGGLARADSSVEPRGWADVKLDARICPSRGRSYIESSCEEVAGASTTSSLAIRLSCRNDLQA